MALSSTARGTGTHNTSATTFTLSPSGNMAAGSMAVLLVAIDNAAAAQTRFSVSDSIGNVWTRRASPRYSPGGVAGDGVEGAIFTTDMGAGPLLTGTTITVTIATARTAKAWVMWEVTAASGNIPDYSATGNGTGSATTTPTVTTSSLTNGNIVIGGVFNEYGTAQTVTADADTTNGTWSAQQAAEIGTTTSGVNVASQTKVVTATATQTYNPTLATSSDVITSWISLGEVGIASSPKIESVKNGFNATAATSHTIDMPSGVAAGDLLLLFFGPNQPTISGWTQLTGQAGLYVMYRVSDGTEGSTETASVSSSYASYVVYRISGHNVPATGIEASTVATGTSSAPDPASLSPSWGSDTNLFFGATSSDLGVVIGVGGSEYFGATDVNTQSAHVGVEGAWANASGYNPGAFLLSSSLAAWAAYTVAVRRFVANPITATPPSIALTDTTYVPVVTATNNITVEIPAATLTDTTYAPLVTAVSSTVVTVPSASLTDTMQVPVVTATNNISVSPPAATLATTLRTPLVTAPALSTVPAASLTTTGRVPVMGLGIPVPPAALTTSLQLANVTAPALTTVPATSLATTLRTPVVSTPVLATVPAASLATTLRTPVVTAPMLATVTAAELDIAGQDPTVSVTNHITTPVPAASLTTTLRTPTVTAPALTTVPAASLATTLRVPVVTAVGTALATPPSVGLTLTTYPPLVSANASVTATPPAVTLAMTAFAPGVAATDHKVVTPPAASLAMTAFAPQAILSDNKLVTPPTASLALTTFAPNTLTGDHKTATPPAAALALTGLAPQVMVSDFTKLSMVMHGMHVELLAQGYSRVYAYPPRAISVPSVIVDYPSSIEYDLAYARGADKFVMVVRMVVGIGTTRTAYEQLGKALLGPESLKHDLDGEYDWGSARVTRASVDGLAVGAVTYAQARVEVEVVA